MGVRQAELPVEGEAEPLAEETAEPEPELPNLPEPKAGATTAAAEAETTEVQIPTWNLRERIPIVPQVWDADMPPVGVGVVGLDAEVDIITPDDSEIAPAAPEPPKKLHREKRKKKWKKANPMAIWSYG
jgi:hypothetical protein